MIWHISSAYKRGGLSLFLGAGVSRGCGLPLWPDLVRALHVETARRSFPDDGFYGTFDKPKGWGGLSLALMKLEERSLASFSLPIQSRFCKSRLGADYGQALQKALYSQPYKPSDTISILSGLSKLKAVCTYNYDDLLESMSGDGHSFVAVAESDISLRNCTPVYHVHGLLPSDLTASPKGDLVFSEDEYHEMYMDHSHWSNLIQLSLLIESECSVFVGISFDDPNLRRILDSGRRARKDLRIINICKLPMERPCNDSNYQMSPFNIEVEVRNEVYSNIGVTNFWIDDFEPDISFIFKSLEAKDPVECYTNLWRDLIANRLGGLPQNGECLVLDCHRAGVVGHRFCIPHLIGDRTRFMDYAPMPKTLEDTCERLGCDKITSGLSGRCMEHLHEKFGDISAKL